MWTLLSVWMGSPVLFSRPTSLGGRKLSFPSSISHLLGVLFLLFGSTVLSCLCSSVGTPLTLITIGPSPLLLVSSSLLEHLVHSRVSPHISPQLDESQSFRWGADLLVGSLVSVLSSRSNSHTFVAFIHIQKAFDTSWVEGTLVRLFDAGVHGRMRNLSCHFFRGTESQVRFRHCPKPGPLSAAVQPSHQWTHCCCAAGCSWCAAVLFLSALPWSAPC